MIGKHNTYPFAIILHTYYETAICTRNNNDIIQRKHKYNVIKKAKNTFYIIQQCVENKQTHIDIKNLPPYRNILRIP